MPYIFQAILVLAVLLCCIFAGIALLSGAKKGGGSGIWRTTLQDVRWVTEGTIVRAIQDVPAIQVWKGCEGTIVEGGDSDVRAEFIDTRGDKFKVDLRIGQEQRKFEVLWYGEPAQASSCSIL